jgi:hypothetical protein
MTTIESDSQHTAVSILHRPAMLQEYFGAELPILLDKYDVDYWSFVEQVAIAGVVLGLGQEDPQEVPADKPHLFEELRASILFAPRPTAEPRQIALYGLTQELIARRREKAAEEAGYLTVFEAITADRV